MLIERMKEDNKTCLLTVRSFAHRRHWSTVASSTLPVGEWVYHRLRSPSSMRAELRMTADHVAMVLMGPLRLLSPRPLRAIARWFNQVCIQLRKNAIETVSENYEVK